jgi:uncharacterized membrane protein (UPF0127 family)
MGALTLVNQRTDDTIATSVEVATSRAARRKGLLGREAFDPSAALVLAPCAAIHTMFMRFAIDVVFVDEEGRALKVVAGLPPWRIAIDPFAHAVIELPAGRLHQCRVGIGDRLYLQGQDGERLLLCASDLRGRPC